MPIDVAFMYMMLVAIVGYGLHGVVKAVNAASETIGNRLVDVINEVRSLQIHPTTCNAADAMPKLLNAGVSNSLATVEQRIGHLVEELQGLRADLSGRRIFDEDLDDLDD